MYEKLPEQLKKDGRFCLWKYEERNGRMTKVPYQTNSRKASSADKNTFSDFRLAVNAMDGYDGIGMGAFDDFCIQRAVMYQDKVLSHLDAGTHTVHPHSYFHG